MIKCFYHSADLDKPHNVLAVVTTWDAPTPPGYKRIAKRTAIQQAQIWDGHKSELSCLCNANGEFVSPRDFIAVVRAS